MITIKNAISAKIAEILKTINADAGIEASTVREMLEYPPDEKMGDLALPCFKLSKLLRMAPVKIAATIAESFEADCVERAEALNG